MNTLAIDASSQNISISTLWANNVFIDFNRCVEFGASKLLYFIDKIFCKYKLKLNDVDIFVIGSGPGSFTGLRASFSIVKAFMLALKKPAVSISSFYTMAYPFSRLYSKIAVISDARKDLIYASSFVMKKGILYKEAKEKLIVLADFISEKPDYFYVSYDQDLGKKIASINPAIKLAKGAVYPKAKYFLKIAQDLYKEKRFIAVEDLEPLYLHPKTCQIRA